MLCILDDFSEEKKKKKRNMEAKSQNWPVHEKKQLTVVCTL